MTGAEHYRRRLISAADQAIAAAPRTSAGTVLVTDGDVLDRLHDDFGMVAVPAEDVTAVLRERLEQGGDR